MGEMANYLINGDDCEGCGMPFDTPGDGYPRKCASCKAEEATARKAKKIHAGRG